MVLKTRLSIKTAPDPGGSAKLGYSEGIGYRVWSRWVSVAVPQCEARRHEGRGRRYSSRAHASDATVS